MLCFMANIWLTLNTNEILITNYLAIINNAYKLLIF